MVTFSDAVTVHLNGEEIHAFHVPPAHTDGDSVIHFRKANVVHMGDLFFNGNFPFVDVSSGGNVEGVIGAANLVLGMVNDQTKIIPGHGPVAGKADLTAYRDMVIAVRDAVRAAGQGRQERSRRPRRPSRWRPWRPSGAAASSRPT